MSPLTPSPFAPSSPESSAVASRPRTAYHPRPRRGWLNDPNGMTFHDGRWHVFFQHNPLVARHGQIHWGHLSSADLVSWREHPVAFGPTPGGPDSYGCWTGVAVPSSDPVSVAYSGVVDETHRSTVCLREALDPALDTWSEPVVVADTPEGIGLHLMRDPYVFDFRGRSFALLGAGLADGTPCLLLYSCDDPRAWHFERVWLRGGEAGTGEVPASQIWECPQLVPLGDGYVVVLSLVCDDRLTDVAYLLGDLKGDEHGLPRWVTHGSGLLDEGGHFYAPQVVTDPSPRGPALERGPLLFGWVLQDNAPDDDHEAVAGCLTLPRRLSLADGALVVRVDENLQRLATSVPPLASSVRAADGPVELPEHALVRLTPAGPEALVLSYGEHKIALDGTAGMEIWTDADVAEVYRPGTVSLTLRFPGRARWLLSGDADIAIHEIPLDVTAVR